MEDEPSLCRAYVSLFRIHDWCPVGVNTVKDALEQLELNPPCRWALILLDYWLPDGNGLQVLKAARQAKSPAKFVVITAALGPGSVNKIMACQPDHFFPKPYGFEQLLDLLKDLRADYEARLRDTQNT